MENVEGQTNIEENKSEGSSENNVVDPIALVEQLKSTNARLLDESKKNAEKYRSLRDQVEAKEKKELEEQENWKQLLDREKDERHQLTQQYEDLKKKALKRALDFEVAKHAPDAQDIDLLITAVVNNDAVDVNEDETGFIGVDDAIKKLRTEKSFLFNSKNASGMVNKVPSTNAPERKKPLSKMSPQERKAEMLKALEVLHKS